MTDRLVVLLVEDSTLAIWIQTAKGWMFVVLSALVVYGLVAYGQRDLKALNRRLDRALQQTSILHRILRHNLRNSCTVIQGNAEILEERVPDDSKAHLERINAQNEQLIRLSEQSRQLRELVLGESLPASQLDLVHVVETRVEGLREAYPNAEIELSLPETLPIQIDPRIGNVLYQIFENGIEHNDTAEPTLRVDARSSVDGSVTIEISDDGPGLPEMEREVLEDGFETPMFHSQGLGLWIARTLVDQVDGTFRVVDNDPRGTVIQLPLPDSA